jgi:hypothetical protein
MAFWGCRCAQTKVKEAAAVVFFCFHGEELKVQIAEPKQGRPQGPPLPCEAAAFYFVAFTHCTTSSL